MSTWHRGNPGPGGPPTGRPGSPLSPPPGWRRWLLPLGFALMVLWLLWHPMATSSSTRVLTYSTLVQDVKAGKVSSATVTSSGAVSGRLVGDIAYKSQIPTALTTPPWPPYSSVTAWP
jgi:cell division protease FtsH